MKNIKEREEELLNFQQKEISPNLQELLAKSMIKNFQVINNKNNENNNIIINEIKDNFLSSLLLRLKYAFN